MYGCFGAAVRDCGSLWPRMCDKPILDLDEVGENKKPFYMGMFLWEGHILAS